MKRGSRSRVGQSAAEGGGAKRWLERDCEPLFRLEAKPSERLLSIRGIDVQDLIPSVDDAGHVAEALEPLREAALLGKPEHLIP